MPGPVIEVRDVRKSYGSFEALRGVSFAIEEGEMFGLLGPNGAGKTTLLSILACLLDPTAGTATLFGRPLHRADLSLRPLIGIGTQDLALYGEMSARENLAFFGRLYGLRGDDLAQRIDAVLDLTALRDKADQRVGTYSGGMKRRLNLGVAIVHRPKILFLDEPTTGIDPQSRNHIFEQVRALNAAGLTVVYTSHYMEEVQALCPRIAILDHGQLIACDALSALLHRLDGTLKVRVGGDPMAVRERFANLADVKLVSADGDTFVLAGADIPAMILQVVAALRELNVELTGLESHEPTLESVFLHLTERTLRD